MPAQPIGFFERYLSVWVALCIAAGIGLGSLFPRLFQTMASFEYGSVNFIVAVLIWLMVYPMMVSVDFSSLKRIRERPKGLIITLMVNWLIKPFTMAGFSVLIPLIAGVLTRLKLGASTQNAVEAEHAVTRLNARVNPLSTLGRGDSLRSSFCRLAYRRSDPEAGRKNHLVPSTQIRTSITLREVYDSKIIPLSAHT